MREALAPNPLAVQLTLGNRNLWDLLKLKILIRTHFTPTEWTKYPIFIEHYSKYSRCMNSFRPRSSNFTNEETEAQGS